MVSVSGLERIFLKPVVGLGSVVFCFDSGLVDNQFLEGFSAVACFRRGTIILRKMAYYGYPCSVSGWTCSSS